MDQPKAENTLPQIPTKNKIILVKKDRQLSGRLDQDRINAIEFSKLISKMIARRHTREELLDPKTNTIMHWFGNSFKQVTGMTVKQYRDHWKEKKSVSGREALLRNERELFEILIAADAMYCFGRMHQREVFKVVKEMLANLKTVKGGV